MASPGRAALIGYAGSYSSLQRRSLLRENNTSIEEEDARIDSVEGTCASPSSAWNETDEYSPLITTASSVPEDDFISTNSFSSTHKDPQNSSLVAGSIGSLTLVDFEMYLSKTRHGVEDFSFRKPRKQPTMPTGYESFASAQRKAISSQNYTSSHGMIGHMMQSPVKGGEDLDDELQESAGNQRYGDASQAATMFNVVNLYVGLGLLSKPYALRLGGWLSLVTLFVCTWLFNYTGKLLVKCFDIAPYVQSFVGLGFAAGGKFGMWIVGVVSIADFFSAVCMCLIIVWNSIEMIANDSHEQHSGWWTDPVVVILNCHITPIILLSTLILVPFIWIRSFGKMSFISAIGVTCNILITAVVAVAALEGTHESNSGNKNNSHKPWSKEELIHWKNLPVSMGIYVLSLAGHPSLPSLRNSMKNPSKFESMLDGSFIIMLVVYIAMAVFGYLSFGDASAVLVTENLNRNAHSQTSKYLNKIVILFVALSSASTIPALIAVTVEMFDDVMDNMTILKKLKNDETSKEPKEAAKELMYHMKEKRKQGIISIGIKRSLVLIISFILAAVSSKFLGAFESIFGGICAINGSMILPAVFYLLLKGDSIKKGQKYRLIIVIVLGCIMLSFIFVMNIYDLTG